MNKKQQLNSLATAYQHGDELALKGLFETLNPMIERASREVENYIDDFTKFDCRVVTEIKRLLETFDEDKHDFLSAAKAVITKSKARYIKRNSRKVERYVSMNTMESPDDGGDELGYQFEGRSPDVEEATLFKETVTLLAQGNEKKLVILSQWSKGAEDKAISELLAKQFGGKATGHRSFIKRFKTECRNRLASETV